MTRERLTPHAIRSDLQSILKEQKNSAYIYRFSFITPFVCFAAIFALFPTLGWLTAIPGVIIAYNLVRLLITLIKIRKLQKKLNGSLLLEDFVITVEKFSHFATDHVWWPLLAIGRLHWLNPYKEIYSMYFSSGKCWHLPVKKPYYAWSDLYATENINNSTLEGDEFYFVRLAKDMQVCYAYNLRRFEM